MIVRKVWRDSANDVLHVTVPKGEGIVEGDYVRISKVEETEDSGDNGG